MHTKKETATNLLLLTSSIIIFLFLAEIVLRNTFIPIQKRGHFEKGAVVKDDVLEYKLRPNQKTIMTNGYFREEVITDSQGFRDIYDNNYGNYGIIAIGDSQTFGYGINAKDTWVEQLQEKLRINVINTGVFGYGALHYEHILRRLYEKGYPVKLVLYEMSGNDATSGNEPIDILTVVDGYLVNNPKYASKKLEGLSPLEKIQESKTYLYIRDQLALGKLFLNAVKEIFGYFRIQIKPHFDKRLTHDMEITKKEILGLKKFLDSIGAELVIVHAGDANLVMPEKWADYQKRHDYSRYYVREAFGDWAKLHGIYFEDAIDILEKRYVNSGRKRTSIILPVNNHYNKEANTIFSDIFYRIIAENNLLVGH